MIFTYDLGYDYIDMQAWKQAASGLTVILRLRLKAKEGDAVYTSRAFQLESAAS